ncbi:hypothetical protein ACTFIU_011266 [Dictyostelium citrinum]
MFRHTIINVFKKFIIANFERYIYIYQREYYFNNVISQVINVPHLYLTKHSNNVESPYYLNLVIGVDSSIVIKEDIIFTNSNGTLAHLKHRNSLAPSSNQLSPSSNCSNSDATIKPNQPTIDNNNNNNNNNNNKY